MGGARAAAGARVGRFARRVRACLPFNGLLEVARGAGLPEGELPEARAGRAGHPQRLRRVEESVKTGFAAGSWGGLGSAYSRLVQAFPPLPRATQWRAASVTFGADHGGARPGTPVTAAADRTAAGRHSLPWSTLSLVYSTPY
jgi:hypothetical protein